MEIVKKRRTIYCMACMIAVTLSSFLLLLKNSDLMFDKMQPILWQKVLPMLDDSRDTFRQGPEEDYFERIISKKPTKKNVQMFNRFVSDYVLNINDQNAESFFIEGEEELLAENAVNDRYALPSSRYSKANTNKHDYNMNDVIEVEIDLLDGHNRRLARGGDDVRVWMTSDQYKTGAEVIDLNNGSYLAQLKAFWYGKGSVHISITYTRDEIRALLRSRRESKVIRYSVGKFNKGNITDLTLCSPFPNIPFHKAVCNLTSINRNPYYCGRPNFKGLSCKDLQQLQTINYNKQSMNELETNLLSRGFRMDKLKDINITINKGEKPSLPQCSTYSKTLTWASSAPHGFFNKSEWNPSFCSRNLDKEAMNKCLQDVHIVMIGDSTVRQMFYALVNMINCQKVVWMDVGYSLRRNRYCAIPDINFKVTFGIHDLPYSMVDHMDNITYTKSIQSRLEAVQLSDVNQVVLIHLYCHFLFFHTSVFVARVKALKNSLVNLLSKNPKVRVFIKGPHSFIQTMEKPIVKSDYFGKLYASILKKELFELRNQIWYLDYWDMSVCVENGNLHPRKSLVREMVGLFLKMACS